MRIGITLTSSIEVGKEYIELTREVAKELARYGFGVVYGGTDYGMMKELAEHYQSAGGKDLVGVMAEDLMNSTKGYKAYVALNERYTMRTVGDRIQKIISLSEGFIILPGGYGTFEEIGAIVGGKVNKLHNKPIVMYNFQNFYKELIGFFDTQYERRFSKIRFSDIAYIGISMQGIINYFRGYSPESVPDKFV